MNNQKATHDNIESSNTLVSSTLQNTETAALRYAAAGLSVIPLQLPNKSPYGISSWAPLQTTIASTDEIAGWFSRPNAQVGIVCGKISGNLEMIDFDEKYNVDPETLMERFKCVVDKIAPGLMDKLVVEKTVSNGFHLVYRCDFIERNMKLAERPLTEKESEETTAGRKTLIETRGEGGYFMCAPSKGYELLQGSFEAIPRISTEERTILFNTARGFDQVSEEAMVIDAPDKLDASVKRPGDDFNQRGDVRSTLQKHGWKMVSKHDKGEYWCRPGKPEGVSAFLKKGKHFDEQVFAVYSTNAHPLEVGVHSLFSVYTKLEYNSKWEEAAASLAKQGFGSTTISEAEDYLSARYGFRLNLITNKTECRELGGAVFEEVNDLQLNSLYRELQRYHIKIGLDVLASLLHSDFVPQYDPFLEFYESLPKWDVTTDHIRELAQTITLKQPENASTEQIQQNNDLFYSYLKKWLVNAVGCAVEPTIVNHTALTLVGPQGYYKTTWLNRLVPEKLASYKFVGTIDPGDKDTMIHLSECFLINLDELETLRRHELGTLKSIMSMQHIRVRRPYGRIAENLVRRASFVGSINKDEFLNDETGSRRFLTFEIASIDMSKAVNMDLVHAQAYALFRDGFCYWFDKVEIEQINERNSNYAVRTTEDELIDKYYEKGEYDRENRTLKRGKWKTATDIAQWMNAEYEYPISSNSARNFGVALTKAGFYFVKSNGIKKYAVCEL
jgi:hypothetical protein